MDANKVNEESKLIKFSPNSSPSSFFHYFLDFSQHIYY